MGLKKITEESTLHKMFSAFLPRKRIKFLLFLTSIVCLTLYGGQLLFSNKIKTGNPVCPAPACGVPPPMIPRRGGKYSLNGTYKLNGTNPSVISCPCNRESQAIFTMGSSPEYLRGSVVLGYQIQKHWNYSKHGPLPDLRFLDLIEKPLGDSSLSKLEKAGWKICHVSRLEPLFFARLGDTFSKLHIWNMTAYARIMWIDSDVMVTKDIGHMMEYSEKLVEPRSGEQGPRIIPTLSLGGGHGSMHTSLFIIKPDCEEYLWLMNLYGNPIVKISAYERKFTEQGFLSSVYIPRREARFSIPYIDNFDALAITRRRSRWLKLKDSLGNIHFGGGDRKPWRENCTEDRDKEILCQRWKGLVKEAYQALGIE